MWFFNIFVLLLCLNNFLASDTLDTKYKIVLHSGIGGNSHIKAVLSIAKGLKEQGHDIYYIAPMENEIYIKGYDYKFISTGSMFTKWDPTEFDELVQNIDKNTDKFKMINSIISGILPAIYEEIYPTLYKELKALNPDILLCDFFSAACRDAGIVLNIPIINTFQHADIYGLSNYGKISNSFGMNEMYLNENSYIQRLHDVVYLTLKQAYYGFPLLAKMRNLRIKFDVPTNQGPLGEFDENMAIANTFMPYEPRLPIQPNFHMVGPIFNKDTKPLSKELDHFLDTHNKVIYIAFGSNLKLGNRAVNKLLKVIDLGLKEGLFNGVIIGLGRTELSQDNYIINNHNLTSSQILSYQHPNLRVFPWAPQQAILRHTNLKLFISHCGLESTFESLDAKMPLLCSPFSADQPRSSQKVVDMGVGLSIDIHSNSINDIYNKISIIINDKQNKFKFQLKRVNQIIKSKGNNHQLAHQLILSHIELTKICNLDPKCYNAHFKQRPTNILLDNLIDIYLTILVIIFSALFALGYSSYRLIQFFTRKTSIGQVKKKQ